MNSIELSKSVLHEASSKIIVYMIPFIDGSSFHPVYFLSLDDIYILFMIC